MDNNKNKKVFFCAVSGNGMSALAQILKLQGYDVYGSDLSFDCGRDASNKKALQEVGIKLCPQDGSGVTPDMAAVYASSAISDDNPDIMAAKKYNIPVKKRSELLAEIFHSYAHNIAVGGTAGKTTTTAMIGYILDKLGQKPCMVNGGFLRNYEDNPGIPNIIYNQGDICVIEADESDGSIKNYYPYIGLINNISHDHEPIETLMEYFETFAEHVKQALVVNYDCPNARKIKHRKQTFTYSIKDRHADIFAYNIEAVDNGVKYSVDGRSFKLQLIGKFNVSNALAAISACVLLGIDKFDAAKALEGFTGIKRRLELAGTKNNISVFDDFAHNASKIEASLSALREYDGRLIVMYQSHKPFSARTTGEEDGVVFGKVLNKDDILLMPEIYMRDPVKDSDISGADLVKYAVDNGVNALFLETKERVRDYILKNARPGDRVVIMGARDNSLPDFSRQLLKAF